MWASQVILRYSVVYCGEVHWSVVYYMIRQHQRFMNLINVTLDTIALLMVFCLVYWRWSDLSTISQKDSFYLLGLIWMVPLLIVIYHLMGVYTPIRMLPFRKEFLMVFRAHLLGMTIFYGTIHFFRLSFDPAKFITEFGLGGFSLILIKRVLIRWTLHYLRRIGYNQKQILIIGTTRLGHEFYKKIRINRHYGYEVIGFIDNQEANADKTIKGRSILGRIDKLPDILTQNIIDIVVIALPMSEYKVYEKIIEWCDKEGTRVLLIPDSRNMFQGYHKIEDFDGIPLINIRYVPVDEPLSRFLKRILDLSVSLTAIIVTAPIMALISIAIKLASNGPVLFKQERIGLNNRIFNMLKFRTMSVSDEDTAKTRWTIPNDPRITKLGAFLRKTSLDELPQFFNVLIGNMSVVGPRPERPFFVEQFKRKVPKYMVKHQVKPGITGWAQVNGWRGDTSIIKRVEFDIYYIENWDLLFDIKIMLLTVYKGLINRNAY